MDWRQRIGYSRDWVWRGWQIRYTFMPSSRELEQMNPPVILLHGFGAAIEHWRSNIPILGKQHRVYALDLLGFGASRKVYTTYNINLWVEQVYDFWRNFLQKPVILVGNSIGSLVCLLAAARYPEMVKGIAMLSLPDVSLRQEALPGWLSPIVTNIENLFASPVLLKPLFRFLRRPNILRKWANIAYEDKKAVTDELLNILANPAQDEGAERAFCALFETARNPNFSPSVRQLLPNISIPMLLCWGRQDRMVPFALASIFCDLNPKIEMVDFDGAGHCLHDECPDRFNAILLAWIEKHFHPIGSKNFIEKAETALDV
ncbi:alpha/beta hydrolase [Aphanothece hegewaldii CCALA 016]|uniref:Alpha/beta hydrolase n=2 Tax=Aphanothece TaxID=1121 RepID=A0A2T1LZB9_9CHRO|nr:alpha/beta fold hydrolase [Aphanothece hegewaldii]PSF37711.1 alpha/beta hydrolase [Aphanothece hegewaldii CCALA 016]